ncbi:MAG: DNA-binding protein WhiA [Clostridia bacterium]|nr:DNA-binding protein WhiA [Clostridia bacterium]
MSFSSEIKERLLENVSKVKDERLKKAETFGEYITINHFKSALERDYNDLLLLNTADDDILRQIIIGSFLSSGYITDPSIDYHVEVIFKNKALADYYINLLSLLDFTPRYIKREVGRNVNHSVYIKEADQVSTYLSILGVSSHMLKFEQIRVEKEVKNNINRKVNCETANLSKTIKASVNQVNAINKLKENKKYNALDKKLKEAAKVRLKYPDDSIEMLANRLNITKSGMKHRLDKIIAIASK